MNTKTEPLITVGSITAVIAAALLLAKSFGIPVSDDQQQALVGFVAVAAPLVVAFVGRGLVFSPSTTQRLVNDAAQTGDTQLPPPPAR